MSNNTDTALVTNALGQQMRVFRADHIGDRIRKFGLYERENIAFMNALLATMKAPVVFDIGANIGNHALALATLAHQVYAFEPVPVIFEVLQDNVQRNGLSNIRVFPLALSDSSGEVEIHLSLDGNVGASSLERPLASSQAFSVQKRPGDDVCQELALERLDFIKLDVESHEASVLRGLRETVGRFLPVIAMEWNDQRTVEQLRGSEIMDFLQENYHLFVITSTHERPYWAGRPLAWWRRKWHRLFREKRLVLTPFDINKVYKNILLVPKQNEQVLGFVRGYHI